MGGKGQERGGEGTGKSRGGEGWKGGGEGMGPHFWGQVYAPASNNMKFVHWPLMGGLLHLLRRGGGWAGPHPPGSSSLNQM